MNVDEEYDGLRKVAASRRVHLCWTCDASVNELEAIEQNLGWGIVGAGSDTEFWECPDCDQGGWDDAD